MNFWNRIEQTFKRRYLKVLERHFAKEVVMPQLINFGKIQNILVVRQHDQLGDFLLCTPVLRALRENFPSARIGLLVREYVADVARNHPYIDDLLIFHEDLRKWTPKEIANFYRQLRDGWELAIVLNTVSHSLTSDLLAYFSGAKYILGSEHRVFPGCSRNFFYNLIAPYWEGERHQTERNLDIVRHIGVETHDLQEVMQLSEKEKETALETLRNAGYRPETLAIGMHVGAGKIRNRWPLEHFAALAQYLNDYFQVQV
ncbi:MAG: lipopolysaccharide heptosyltransferase family protein, partial [Calditrichaeota bacterium]